jgi:hypothetical protein
MLGERKLKLLLHRTNKRLDVLAELLSPGKVPLAID